jgi:hypothetical protein
MFLWEADREVIKVQDRKGFVRIAVSHQHHWTVQQQQQQQQQQ